MKEKLKRLFSLSGDQAEREEIDHRIQDGSEIQGSNLYILIFAILIASIGLNVNSTAVVIGAMLISPLMGVIINFAFGIASQDFSRARNSILRLIIQIVASIMTSTLYFVISPLNTFSSELMARTTPTFWDVLIAFFGGFSAIIALTRKSSVSNVIPGAAIATALMPPLCTVGYCLSHAEWLRALGAFYLFMINTVFICISSIIGLYIMNIVDIKKIFKNKKQRNFLVLTIVIAIIPSSFLAWCSVKQDRIHKNYKEFLETEFAPFENTEIVKADISITDKEMEVFLMGDRIEENSIQSLHDKLSEYELENYKMHIIQTNLEGGVSREELDHMIHEGGFLDKETVIESEKDKKMLELINASKELQKSVSREILLLYPNVQKVGFTETLDRKEKVDFTLVLTVFESFEEEEIKHISQWMKERFNKEVTIEQILITE